MSVYVTNISDSPFIFNPIACSFTYLKPAASQNFSSCCPSSSVTATLRLFHASRICSSLISAGAVEDDVSAALASIDVE